MIRNNVKIKGVTTKADLKLINNEDLIIDCFNFEINKIENISSLYELTLNIDDFFLNKITLKNSILNSVSFMLSAKVLYSNHNDCINIKEYTLPYIYSIKTNNNILRAIIIDCNLAINHQAINLSILVGFIKDKPSIKIYKTKNYIKTTSEELFDSTFDFL